ncbi:MAG: hypothetical protein ABIO70_02905 [Pseudomonadota bacterium]
MTKALGYSQTCFDPANPGRLCRGRERWIEGYPIPDTSPLQRLVVSGASFSDDTARDARRGLSFSGLTVGQVLAALFPDRWLLAFCEQGEIEHVPEGALLVEEHLQPRFGGRRMDLCVRWRVSLAGVEAFDAHVGEQPWSVAGFVPWVGDLSAALEEALFLLTGQGTTLGMPRRGFQPSALPQLLDLVPWVALVHLDKHGLALGIYSIAPIEVDDALVRLAGEAEALPVPFSIPPMLARWDRALYELRQAWHGPGEFPVPPGEKYIPSYQDEPEDEEGTEE